MKLFDLELEDALLDYLKAQGFLNASINWTNHKKGKVIVGNEEDPDQEIPFTIRSRRWLKSRRVEISLEERDYLKTQTLEYIAARSERAAVIRPYEDIGFYGQRSPNLKAVYKRLPSLKKLVLANYLFGAMNSLIETSANAKLFMNLGDIAVWSMVTDSSLTIPGQMIGEKSGIAFINEVIAAHTPTQKIRVLYEQKCHFTDTKNWRVRIDLEEHLRSEYFKHEDDFTAKYLAKVDDISKVLKAGKSGRDKAQEIAKLLFGSKPPAAEKDPLLYQHLRNLASLDTASLDQALRDFYGQISAIPANIPNWKKLWTRKQYRDLVENLCSAAEHGYYEEMDEELRVLRDVEKTIKDVKAKKKMRKEDIDGLERIGKEYLAFLLSNQRYFHEGEENLSIIRGILEAVKKGNKIEPKSRRYLETFIDEYKAFLLSVQASFTEEELPAEITENLGHANSFMAECISAKNSNPSNAIAAFEGYIDILKEVSSRLSKQTLEGKVTSMRAFMKKLYAKDVNAQSDELDDILNYIDARQFAMKKAGVSEKRVYISLADAQKKFLDGPVGEYTRRISAQEMESISELCFKEMNRANIGALGSTIALAGMIQLSEFIGEIPGGRLANALAWGSPIAIKSIIESYWNTKGGRVMAYFLLTKYRAALKQEGVDAESAFSELDSVIDRVYLAGYMTGAAVGLPFMYGTTPERQWPILVTTLSSAALIGIAYKTWLSFEKDAKSEISVKPIMQPTPILNSSYGKA